MVKEMPSKITIKKKAVLLLWSFLFGLVIGFILVVSVGFLVDVVSYSELKKIGNRALHDLKKEYISPDSNAWVFYGSALDKIGFRSPSPALIRMSNTM